MVTYIRSDLDFILAQIKIAEAHADGATLFGPGGLIPANNISWGLRTVDGTYNNLIHPEYGSADQPFPELLDPDYRPAGEVLDMNGPAPGGETAANYNPSNNPGSVVVDSSIRTISNLIVDQSLANPAAVEKALDLAGITGTAKADAIAAISVAYEAYTTIGDPAFGDLPALQAAVSGQGLEMEGTSLVMDNVAPDGGLSASFNSWFTLFGQFFDHGLDLVSKGGSGTVFVPLQPDDPLYDPSSQTNFMVLTRATVGAGTDGIMGTSDDVRPVNLTTPFVDQNQTYTSHPSHQVFLREYVMTANGPVATGNALDGAGGGLPTWGEVKAQARDLLGIDLTDYHVGNLPLLATDPYGNFIPGPGGFPQVVMAAGGLASGTPAVPLVLVSVGDDGPDPDTAPDVTHLAVRTGHAFLDDIAHTAVPVGKVEDGDQTIGLANPGQGAVQYDNELLDAHFITGDGRGNENIGLTAVHTVFHAEHNRLVGHTKEVVLAEGNLAFLNEWLRVDVAAVPTSPAAIAALQWDGERLFQAAKFGTEMQYQHLVFEEFARKIQPNIDVFLVPQGYDVTIDPAIVAEFAHVVYRFGHSMLTETIDRFDPTFTADNISLIQGFLNPTEFLNGGTAAEAAGSIIRGMTRQVGNEIDEFVTGALRNNLLGLPLDLATINMARGRDTGVPSLNAARRDFYEATDNNSELRPYESWVDFAGGIKNPAAIVNFIAAYGLHPLITGQTTVEGKRDAALTLITGFDANGVPAPADAVDFLNSTGDWASTPAGVTTTGLDNVDLWVGGLAEKNLPFGGMLGSTFNFVFEIQMEKLQNSDRFYYLQRLDGLHLFSEMEANSFASLIMRNTDATHLPSDVFSTPGLILEVDKTKQYNAGFGPLGNDDPTGGSILVPLVIRNNPATPGTDNNYLRYTGGDHIVLGGTEANDTLIGSEGDDTFFGDGGNDKIEGGAGNDIINGGAGDDIITDLGGDDNIKGGDGNDAINAGQGLNLTLGGAGNDFIIAGSDPGSEVFGGTGDDFILGTRTTERILGNEGSDWIERGTFDGAPGDNFDEIFARDDILGHDVFLGDGSTDEYIGEGGDDIFVGSAGINKLEGMSGFDWATYKDNPSGPLAAGVYADLLLNAFDEFPLPPAQAALDQYGNVEGLSGSAFNDTLFGSDVTSVEMPTEGNHPNGSILTTAGIGLITGLNALLGNGVKRADGGFDGGNIILGGDGDDTITGRGGDDVIDGDKWLDVQIRLAPGANNGEEFHNSMTTLVARMFAGTINPSQLSIVRQIRTADGTADIDTAVYSGPRANYTITFGAGFVRVTDNVGDDGSDTLYNMELVRFSDQDVFVNNRAPIGQPAITEATPSGGLISPTEGQVLTATPGTIDDPNGLTNPGYTYRWEALVAGVWTPIAGATAVTFTPTQAQVNQQLRVVATFTDDIGVVASLASDPTIVVGDLYVGTAGANTFNGTEGSDNASGLGGNDTLNGNGGDDTLNGGANNDTLNGGAGNDTLIGDTGNDTLNGGLGADAMSGGTGDDTYIVDDALDSVTEPAINGGTDSVQTTLASYTLTAGVENLTHTLNLAFTGTGNNLNNRIQSGNGNNILDGGTGNDTLIGGGGDDTYYVNAGGDVVTEAANAGIDTVIASVTDTLDANVENLTLAGIANINGTGQGLANIITGNNGNNALSGQAGNDTLNGGIGNDTLTGNGGDDTLRGGDGNDALTGNAGVDTFVGGIGNDTLFGGAGNEFFVFETGFGNDLIDDFDANPGGGGQDRLDVRALGIGIFGAEVTITSVGGGDDTLITFAAGGTIRLQDVTSNTVTVDDFILL